MAVALGGCGREKTPAASASVPPREGHVYVAQLIKEHPLYDQLLRLDLEIAALRAPYPQRNLSPPSKALQGLLLDAPATPQFPFDLFAQRRSSWDEAVAAIAQTPTGEALAPDLEARLTWQRRQAEGEASRRLARAWSEERMRLAAIRAQAIRARQEALNNAGLDLRLPDKEARAAAEIERRRLWDEINAQVEAARLEGEKRLQAFEAQVRAETDGAVAAAEADFREQMQRRTEVRLKTGSKTRAQMSKALAAPEPMVPRPLPTWRPEVAAVLREAPQDAELRRVRAGAEVRRAQAERLARRRSELAARLSRATELAVRRTAGMDGIVVHIPPAEPPVGANLTEQMRPALRTLFGRH